MSDDVEDVWAIVHERDGLRRRVKQLEAENRRLRIIVAGYAKAGTMKPEDVNSPMPRRRASVRHARVVSPKDV